MTNIDLNQTAIAETIKSVIDKIKNRRQDKEAVGYYESITNKDETIPLILLNDPRSINIHNLVIKLLSDALKSSHYKLEPLDYCSIFFNKTKHINYYLRHDLSYGDMKLIQKFGTIKELCHAAGIDDMENSTKKQMFRGGVSLASELVYGFVSKKTPEVAEPEKVRISNEIKNARLPIAVLLTGINDIMYYLHANPYNLKQTYQNKPDMFKFAAKRAEDPAVLDTIIHCHRENIEDLKALNPNTDIYVVGAYLFSRMEKEYEKPFKDFIEQYNVRLEKLCAETGATYIDSSILVKEKCNGPVQNFVGRKPPILMSRQIVEAIKRNQGKRQAIMNPSTFKYDNKGLYGIAEEIEADINRLEAMLQKEIDKALDTNQSINKVPIIIALRSKIAEGERELDVVNQAIAEKERISGEVPIKRR